MTIRDLLSLNTACTEDYITIKKEGKTILKLISISELHPVWLNYEIEKYYLLPHKEVEKMSIICCDYIIKISGMNFFQEKTELDRRLYESFNERNIAHESTNNN